MSLIDRTRPALSGLIIDVNKDWLGYVIKNLGAPVDAGDAVRKAELDSHRTAATLDHPDGSVTASKLATLDYVTLKKLTADPALAAGRVWLRDVAPYLRFSPDGTTVRSMDVDYHKSLSPIDHPDGSVTRAKLEYPTVNVPIEYLWMIGKATVAFGEYSNASHQSILTTDSFADRSIKAIIGDIWGRNVGRLVDAGNFYDQCLNANAATADHFVRKSVAGTITTLGSEALDIVTGAEYFLELSILGTALKGFRNSATAQISVTDTALASGRWGCASANAGNYGRFRHPFLATASSPSFKALAYFEVPVIGEGTMEDPFRAQMPQEIITDPVLGRRNLLSVSHSSLIKTDRATGKPTEYVAIVRVFEQPDRDPALRPIAACLDALRGMIGVRELTREEAIRRAKQIDPDLMDVDLMPIPATHPNFKQILKDYIMHRKGLGVREELIDEKLMIQYLQEDKGW